ncbi:ComF family protein [Streptomyces sp. SPB074]|uniref:ComF family protein n=1 Tax=Streptomyces sp. (strain SPB074) TaxID=465543 RepID=UPI001F174B16|nr:ComF family protein [Streptomyces sp. SPB074]
MDGWWSAIAELVLPAECLGCGSAGALVCGGCREVLDGKEARAVRPEPGPPGLPGVSAAVAYEGRVRTMVLAYKERGALGLAGPLGAALAAAVGQGGEARGVHGDGARGAGGFGRGRSGGAGAGPVVLVPVPSARRAVRARGHDHVAGLARAAARRLRAEGRAAHVLPALVPCREVRDQAGLGARERRANLAGALRVRAGALRLLREAPPHTAFVLVDDVMTTGATIAEAARALRAADVEGVQRGDRSIRPGGAGERITGAVRAAVVAVSPRAFEINRK